MHVFCGPYATKKENNPSPFCARLLLLRVALRVIYCSLNSVLLPFRRGSEMHGDSGKPFNYPPQRNCTGGNFQRCTVTLRMPIPLPFPNCPPRMERHIKGGPEMHRTLAECPFSVPRNGGKRLPWLLQFVRYRRAFVLYSLLVFTKKDSFWVCVMSRQRRVAWMPNFSQTDCPTNVSSFDVLFSSSEVLSC